MTATEINNLLIGYITLFVTAVGSYLAYNVNFSSINDQRLRNVYSPLFIKFEPNLYKKITIDVAKDYAILLYKIVNKYHLLCDPMLIDLAEIFITQVKSGDDFSSTYIEICSNIDRNYDKLKRKLKLPRRKLLYRIQHRQFANKHQYVSAIITYFVIGMLRLTLATLAIMLTLSIVIVVLSPLIGKLTGK